MSPIGSVRRVAIAVMVLLASFALRAPGTSAATAAGSWTTKAPMPTDRAEAAYGTINGLLYVAGGENGGDENTPGVPLATLEVYNPISNTWTCSTGDTSPGCTSSTLAPMPTASGATASAVINGRLYVAGPFATLEAYDPTTNTWTTLASMPTPEADAAAATLNGKLYVAGGIRQSGVLNNPRNALLQIYDPGTNTWTTGASMPTARASARAVAINGLLYVVGGTGNDSAYTGVLEVYDPATNTWTSKTSMPTPRQSLAANVVNGRLYAIGGAGATALAVNEVYDPRTDTWTTDTPMPTARWEMASGVINGTIYLVGGLTGGGQGVPQTVNEAFTAATLQILAGAGWNLVGGSPLTLWPDSDMNWAFDAAKGQWYQPTGAEPAGTGTWEYVSTPGMRTVYVQPCSGPISVSVVAYRWNMVGNPCSTLVTLPTTARGYRWNGSAYVLTTTIPAGQAAWVKPTSSSLSLTP